MACCSARHPCSLCVTASVARWEAPLLAAEINALPERVRQYIHDLEARCDPSGDIKRIASLEEQRDALLLLLAEARGEPAPWTGEQCAHDGCDRNRGTGSARCRWHDQEPAP